MAHADRPLDHRASTGRLAAESATAIERTTHDVRRAEVATHYAFALFIWFMAGPYVGGITLAVTRPDTVTGPGILVAWAATTAAGTAVQGTVTRAWVRGRGTRSAQRRAVVLAGRPAATFSEVPAPARLGDARVLPGARRAVAEAGRSLNRRQVLGILAGRTRRVVLDLATGQVVWAPEGEWTPDAGPTALCREGADLVFRDLATGEERGRLGHVRLSPVSSLAVAHPDASRVVTWGETWVSQVRADGRQDYSFSRHDSPTDVAYVGEGDRIVVRWGQVDVTLHDAADGALRHVLAAPADRATPLSVVPLRDGTMLVASRRPPGRRARAVHGRHLARWTADGRLLAQAEVPVRVRSGDDPSRWRSWVAAAAPVALWPEPGGARVWRLDGDATTLLLPHDQPVLQTAVRDDGRTAATLDADDVLRVWDLTRADTPLVTVVEDVLDLGLEPDGEGLAVVRAQSLRRYPLPQPG